MDALSPPDAAGNHASLSPEVAHPPIFVSAHRNIVCQSGTQIVAALGSINVYRSSCGVIQKSAMVKSGQKSTDPFMFQ